MRTNAGEPIDEIEALLPWYAAGALDKADAARVEAALERRPELRASLDLVREDRDETILLNESLGAPRGEAWAKVMAAMQAEPRAPSLASRFAFLADWIGLGPRPNRARLALAGVAAALVIAVQSATIVSMQTASRGPGYQSATAPAAPGAEVLVAFAPDLRLDQLGAWLQARHATIVEGPRGGFYRLRVGDKKLDAEAMAKLVKELGADPEVKMALPGGGG